ncbi:hypothetical protein ACRALDRAFT_1059775 [Sodiomyces alcalophilus JCM 7366]|uniref:uncharacterized protein n=1 Tax=Sodiomyces alcalophilus JCM 7366 TaxID=591952 RepID=UPI0039B43FA8
MGWALASITASIFSPSRHFFKTNSPPRTSFLSDKAEFDAYARQLTPLSDFLASMRHDGLRPTFDIVEFSHLTEHSRLPGKNHARVVALRGNSPSSRLVFKGFDFDAFLQHGPGFHEHQKRTMLHEIRTLASLPPHPNIMPCPTRLVVVHGADGIPRVCGFLQPVMRRATLDDQITKAGDRRIPLARKARWCRDMAAAVLHTHRVAGAYHMDLKPGNMLVDDTDGIRLIDWEQSGVSMFTHAKEVTIDQGAREEQEKGRKHKKPRIVYIPRTGPKRCNLPWGYPDWNVFPEWKCTCPRAAELAEVFSLGRVMWMLFEQVEQSPAPTVWTNRSNDVPDKWKAMANRCLELDPNRRPELDELVDFWERELVASTGRT